MSTARAFEDYFGNGALDENVLMTDYWLEYVAARDDRDSSAQRPANTGELLAKTQEFTHRINALSENQAKLMKALGQAPLCGFSRGAGTPDTSSVADQANSPAPLTAPITPRHTLPEVPGPFARGKDFVSNCLRDSFILDVMEKLK